MICNGSIKHITITQKKDFNAHAIFCIWWQSGSTVTTEEQLPVAPVVCQAASVMDLKTYSAVEALINDHDERDGGSLPLLAVNPPVNTFSSFCWEEILLPAS